MLPLTYQVKNHQIIINTKNKSHTGIYIFIETKTSKSYFNLVITFCKSRILILHNPHNTRWQNFKFYHKEKSILHFRWRLFITMIFHFFLVENQCARKRAKLRTAEFHADFAKWEIPFQNALILVPRESGQILHLKRQSFMM